MPPAAIRRNSGLTLTLYGESLSVLRDRLGPECLFDGSRDLIAFRKDARAEPGDDPAVASDQVFLEVPFHAARDRLVRVGRQKLIEWALIIALDRDLRKDVILRVFFPTECLDDGVGPRLLPAEVVGREREDLEALLGILGVYRLQTGVRAVGVASLARHVDDQQHVAFVLRQGDVLSVDVLHGKVVD